MKRYILTDFSDNAIYGNVDIESIRALLPNLNMQYIFGEADTNDSPVINLAKVSHRITNITVSDDGKCEGDVEFLDTPNGKILQLCQPHTFKIRAYFHIENNITFFDDIITWDAKILK